MSANPYLPPKAALEKRIAGEYWREGKRVVMRPGGVLPPRCVKCNAPALQPMAPRKVHWHHPAWFLLILVNILIFIIVGLLVRRKAEVTFGVCARHRLRRRIFIAVGWGGLFLGFLIATGGGAWTAVGILMIVAAILIGMIGARLAYAARITKTEVRLAGCGRAFLDSIEANAPLPRTVADLRAGGETGPLGTCPNCEEVIPLDARECPECKALFGPGSEWKIEPLRT